MGAKAPKRIALLGATGSIGTSALAVIRSHPDEFELVAASAHTNSEKLATIAREFHPRYLCLSGVDAPRASFEAFGAEVFCGAEGLQEISSLPEVDVVIVAPVGFSAMRPLIAAAKAKKRIACANKEAIVCAGDIIMPLLAKNQLIPVDSEHSAIFQCLAGEDHAALERIWLTCSGGPFLNSSAASLSKVRPEDALKHPKWSMGDKITIDSATLMNKGLEVIEAHHLFSARYDQISVLIHPESVIHSMVTFVDGSTKAQLAATDMSLPIQYACTYPDRIDTLGSALDFYELSSLHFSRPNMEIFRCLSLALFAGTDGGTAPCIMNAANEVANAAFRAHALAFTAIPNVIEAVLERMDAEKVTSIQQLEEVDATSRALASEYIKEHV